MTKEEFLKNRKEILDKIENLNMDLKFIKGKYIKSNIIFKIGDAVEVEHKKLGYVKAFVIDYNINYKGEIEIKLNKSKKDGTQSLNELMCYNYKGDTIRKYDGN